jgi:hypothetical protein
MWNAGWQNQAPASGILFNSTPAKIKWIGGSSHREAHDPKKSGTSLFTFVLYFSLWFVLLMIVCIIPLHVGLVIRVARLQIFPEKQFQKQDVFWM